MRTILFVTNKQKWSREDQEYATLADIVQAFTNEIANPTANAAPKAASEPERKVTDVSKATPAEVALFQHPHLKIGSMPLGYVLWGLIVLL